jgi:hypothetical protein
LSSKGISNRLFQTFEGPSASKLSIEILKVMLTSSGNKNCWNQQSIQALIVAERRNKGKVKRKLDEDDEYIE